MNLPEHETKDFLLKLSAKWRKRLAEEQPLPGAPERQVVNRDKADTSFSLIDRGRSEGRGMVERSREAVGAEALELDDTDVLTQAARGVAFAYHQAADYVDKSEKEGQCVVQ